MVLAKNRIPILAVGIVLFLGLLFTFYGLQRVNAQTPPDPDISWDQAFDSNGTTADLWVVMVLTVKGDAEEVEISVGDLTQTVDAPDEGVITAVKVSDLVVALDDDGILRDPDVTTLKVLDSDGTVLVTSSEPEGAEDLVPSTLGWKYQARGNQALVEVKLPDSGLSAPVVAIEVYPVYSPRQRGDHQPALNLKLPTQASLPTDRVLSLTVSNLRAEPTGFRLLFFDVNGNLLTLHEGTSINEAVVVGPSYPWPPPERTPRPTPTPVPPPAGDYSPASGALIAMMLAGLLLVVAGGAYVLQTRRTR
jgi:hypothetical protein